MKICIKEVDYYIQVDGMETEVASLFPNKLVFYFLEHFITIKERKICFTRNLWAWRDKPKFIDSFTGPPALEQWIRILTLRG